MTPPVRIATFAAALGIWCVASFIAFEVPGGGRAQAQSDNISAKEAFEAARVLGTAEAWEAFLASYPNGFYADLARAYAKKLAQEGHSPGSPAANPAQDAPPSGPARDVPRQSAPASPLPLAAAAGVPRAVERARTTQMPNCTLFVDGAGPNRGDGSPRAPHKTIAAAVAAARPGAVICVAEGVYAEQLKPGEKPLTLAGGFQRGKDFVVRDSAAYVTRAQGRGGSFLKIEDPAPTGNELTAIDGFEITGYSQAIVRDYHDRQRFEITNNHIHDNKCADQSLAGAGFALTNVVGRIAGNVFRNNACGRGGAGFLSDGGKMNDVRIEHNLVEGNAGTEPDSSHGGAFYLFGNSLRITGNRFAHNSVTNWGGGLYIGAWTEGGQFTTANLNWNVYHDNRAGIAGGGMFCDDGARCASYHEIYYRNCGGNIFLDSGGGEPTVAEQFDHLTNAFSLAPDCKSPGAGVRIDRGAAAPDSYSFVNGLFWGNAPGLDIAANCDESCGNVRINVSHSVVQTEYGKNGLTVTFGPGIMKPADPLFADPDAGDFHLKSRAGRWTAQGHVQDAVTSPAIGKGYSEGKPAENPPRAGDRIELGAYGNSVEASYAQ